MKPQQIPDRVIPNKRLYLKTTANLNRDVEKTAPKGFFWQRIPHSCFISLAKHGFIQRFANPAALLRRSLQNKHLSQPKSHEVKTKGEILFFISHVCLEMAERGILFFRPFS